MKIKFIKSSGNVFKDAGFNDVEARNLHARSCLMNLLVAFIQKKNLRKKKLLHFCNYSPCRGERPLLPAIQRKIVLAMLTILACMLRLLGQFFVEYQPKLNVLRLSG